MRSRPHLNSFVFLLVFQHLLTGVHLSEFKVPRHTSKRGTHEEDGFSKGLCESGKSQSPIDIDLSLAVTVYHWEPFMFNPEYRLKSLLKIKNDGHTVKASLLPMLKQELLPTLWGGGLRGRFVFEQLHFHWAAEHMIDGKRHQLEMHLVHYNSRYKNFTEALKHQDGVAVLAVLFDHSSPKSREIESFFHWVRDNLIYGDVSGELSHFVTDIEPSPRPYFALRNMLPENVNKFIRYNGSLTTPPCSEVVQWTVLLDRFYVPESMLKDFRNLKDHHGHFILKNYRDVQPSNDRIMFIKKGDSTKNEGQSSKIFIPLIVTSLLFHLKLSV